MRLQYLVGCSAHNFHGTDVWASTVHFFYPTELSKSVGLQIRVLWHVGWLENCLVSRTLAVARILRAGEEGYMHAAEAHNMTWSVFCIFRFDPACKEVKKGTSLLHVIRVA